MKSTAKKTLILALAIVVIIAILVAAVVGKDKSTDYSSMTLTSLDDLFDDNALAKDGIEAMRSAGLIDENGKMVDLDVRENGRSVDLTALATRIASGEDVGEITVNGNAVTTDKIMQLQQVSSSLDVIDLMDRDVEITEAHVANLQMLLEDIATGKVNLGGIISGGTQQINVNRGSPAALPDNTGTGEVDATDGTYTAPYISGSTYNDNYKFTLNDPDNKTWYTESTIQDGVVTLTCDDTAEFNSTVKVTATLNKTQPVPVSFDWSAGSDVITLTGTTSGTVTWEANDIQLEKSFTVTIGDKSSHWVGSQCMVINASNLKNAEFGAGNGTYVTETCWSKIYQFSANESEAVLEEYPAVVTEYPLSSLTRVGGDFGAIAFYFYYVKTSAIPSTDRFTVTASSNKTITYIYLASTETYTTINAVLNSNLVKSSGDSANPPQIRYENGVISNAQWNGGRPNDDTKATLRDSDFSSASERAAVLGGGECWLIIQQQNFPNINSQATITVPQMVTKDEITNISIPAGTYYSGQIVPITVTLKEHAIAAAGTTLTVNGVQAPMLNDANTEAKTFTFGYTVKATDSGSFIVTALSNTLKNRDDLAVTFDKAFPTTSFGIDQGVNIASDVKLDSFDWGNVKYGIDDAKAGEEVVTVVIPFKNNANKTWITNENVELTSPISMPVPGYETSEAVGYLRGAYFSADSGNTRYPVYVLGDNADALVARFVAPLNSFSYLRMDNLQLYLDTEVGTTKEYFGSQHTDAMGYIYFNTTNSSALAAMNKSVSYYVKASIVFDSAETVARPGYDEANIMKNSDDMPNGFYKDGVSYIVVQDDNYEAQHDVEIWANEALYRAIVRGIRAEDPNMLLLNYQFSNRKNFTFTEDKYFSWSSSDERIASVIKNSKTGTSRLILNGIGGEVTLTLTVENGSERCKYDISFTITVLEGKTPFLSIPEFSKERTTLTETDTDVLFSSNITARNAAVEKETTTFTAKLYKVSSVNEVPVGNPIWTTECISTTENTLTHITIPGDNIDEAGIYAVVVSTKYEGGEIYGVMTDAEELSATAYLIVKQAPLRVTLNQLESYSVDYKTPLTIGYTIKPGNANAVVEYTIQKSGEAVSERKSASGGVIPFTAEKPNTLKDAYTITVYARSTDAATDDAWSVDSMLLRVYNMDVLDLIVKDVIGGEIGGTTGGTGDGMNGGAINMDNHDKLEDYGITGDSYQLTVSDLNFLRTDMSLQKIISANYGSGVWGLLSDKMQWESSDSDLVSINYKQGGFYSDINNYSYTSYGPATDFLLVGKDDADSVTITVTHAGTGATASVTVKATTLKNQLYIFQFFPKVETDVIYFTSDANGKSVKRTLKSDANGVLAVYEPNGIKSAVMAMCKVGNETYVGTIYANELESGERDIASLQLYPINNLRLRSISNAMLTFLNPNGSAYSGIVTLRVGVYKNGIYCPDAKVFLDGDTEGRNGREDVVAQVIDGKLTLGFDPTSFKNDPENAEETGAYPGDKITYVVEYRVGQYQTSYTIISVYTDVEGEQDPMDSVIQLKTVKGGGNLPQIIRQTMQQYSDDKPLSYTRDVINYTENIGISKKFNKVVLTTDFILPSSTLSVDGNGHTTLNGEFAFYTVGGRKLTGQTDYSKSANTINNLADMNGSDLFVFPFSAAAFGHHVYTMTDDNMKADGITDEGTNPTASTRIKMMFVRDGMTVMSQTLPFGVSNLSHQPDLADENGDAKDVAADIKEQLASKMNIGEIFKSVNVNDMLQKGFAFLSGLSSGEDSPISLMIIPTEDPGVFRIIAFVGEQDDDDDDGDGVSINYDVNAMYEEYKELFEDDDDDDDDDDYEINFSGTIVLEAGYDISNKKWKIDFLGGSVGSAFSTKYEWSQNFLCGPIPVTISFEVGANAEFKVSFANKSSVKQMLVDATVGVSIEAFAGIGFDISILKLKLGIYGSIGANVNFLLFSDFKNENYTGAKLTINGEIGIRLEVKVLFVKYKKTFASTGFNWTKKWNSYDYIQRQWEDNGSAEIFGLTRSGRAYAMQLLPDGTALVAIDGDGELENRDYLELGNRAWNNGAFSQRGLRKGTATNALSNVQTNAYPYSNPVFVDDGSMFLYISDNDNADAMESVVSYAVRSGNGYTNEGAIYDTDGAILGDSDVVASGAGENIFAAWVKQNESPEKEMNDRTTYADLGMMMNATEVYAATYNGTTWTTTRITDNKVADMAPTIASHGERAIVAWRSLSATKMPESGKEQDFSSMFDAENNINFSIYDGTQWTEANVAYNGSAGTVNAIDSAMLSDGTAILVYTVRTGEDVTTTETFYTIIGTDGKVLTTGRLTNDCYTDTNAQVVAVGEQFVVGWYSEHDTGKKTIDPDTGKEQNVIAHDICLARINKNGSVDESFPESIGGSDASDITSDFRFSIPVNSTNINDLSIVWSQKKNSEDELDNGKYEINAMRFYESGSAIGMTSRINIAETENYFTVDHFDAYTDEDGKVHVIVLGSDYNSLEGLAEYDTIDLTNQPIETSEGSNLLTILEQNPMAYIKLGAAQFSETAIEVACDTNLYELVPGLDLPVQFTVKNIGTSTIDKVNVQFGNINKTVEGLTLLPNQSTTISIVYSVPEIAVQDVDYIVTADETTAVNGTMVLNRPDVGISSMKILREENGERDIQVVLYNKYGIPLAESGKTVKLAFYKDKALSQQVGETFTVPASSYADIDNGIFVYNQTLKVMELIDNGEEIPDSGIRIYAKVWIEESNGEMVTDIYSGNNTSSVSLKGLLTRNGGQKITSDTYVEILDSGYQVTAEIQNNSLQAVTTGIPVVVLLDNNGKVIAQKNIAYDALTLDSEERISDLIVTFIADEVNGTPAQAVVRFVYTITFDVNGGNGEFEKVITDVNGHVILPNAQPTPSQNVPTLFFRGWYSTPTGGELITGNTLFNNHATVYARYTPHQHVFECIENNGDTVTVKCVSTAEDDCPLEGIERTVTLTIVAPERAATGYGMPNATITGEIDKYSMPEICYYTATAGGERGEALTSAPVDAGKYWAEFTLNDGGSGITAYVVYEISYIEGVIANNVQVPNFVKVTDSTALNTLTTCSAAEAYAWISDNANMLSAGDPWAEKIVVYGKQYMVRPDYVPEEYWDYDDNTEYAMCLVYMYSRWESQVLALDELTERISNARGDVYIKGAGSTQMVASVEFENVVSREDLTAVSCTELDAVLWILANINRYPQGMVVFAVDNENCSYIQYTAKSVTIQNTRTSWLLDESYGMPVFIARPSDVLNPYKIYTVVYDANGGTGNAGGTFYVKSHIEIADGSGFSKPNLVFNGWNTKADGTGDAYQPGDTFEVLGNTTFYAQWKHVHNWSIAYNEDTHVFTATCDVPGCPHSSLTLHPEAVDKMYDGQNAKPYTCSDNWTEVNGLPLPTVTYYVGGEKVAEAKNVGAYTAVVSLDGHDVEVSEFHITKRPIIVIADDKEIHEGEEEPDLTVSYDSVSAGLCFDNDAAYPWQIVTEGDRVYVKSGNGGRSSTTSTLTLTVTLTEAGTLSFDYKYGTENNWDWCYFRVDGSEKFKQSNVRDWTTYSIDLSAGTHTLTWAYSKDGSGDGNGDFYAVDNVVIKSGGEVTTAEQESPNIAFNEALNVFEGGIVEGDTLNYTISREEGEVMGTYTITVVMGDNPNYDVQEVRTGTFTILESLGDPQTIVADDVTATYGDTGLKINAEVTVGEGTLSYSVKSGDAVTVDAEGNLTIVKAGTAVITVKASQTEIYAPATKNVTVTIEKATPSYTVPTNLLAKYGQMLANVTLTGGFAWTNNTLSVGDIGSRTFKVTFTPADTTNYKVIENIDVTVTVEPKTIIITGATLVSRDYAEGNVAVSVSAVTFDGAILTIDTDYTATAQMSDDTAGNKTATVTVVLQNNNYVLSQSTYAGTTVTINKVDYTGNKSANATLIGMMGKTSVVTLPTLPDGASYGIVTSDNDAFFTIGEIANGKVTLTSAKDYQETELTAKTFTVAVSGATNYNDYIVTVTITPTFKEEQTISTETTITATYGDTGLSIAANTTGDGDISYALTSGDAVTVNAQTGEITIVKAGTATITVTAAETEDYAEATFDVTVTINKATPEYTAPIGLSATYGDTLNDVVLTTGWTWNAPTTNVGVVGSRAFAATFTPNDTDNYDTVELELIVTVEKATPAYTVPTGLTATYGDTLNGVVLTSGWTWNAPASSVGMVGNNQFAATFTPNDTDNYETVQDNVIVTVNAKAVTLELYVDGVIVTEATSIVYDGQEHTFVVKAIGVNDEVITIDAETQTNVFSSTEFIVDAQNLTADGSEYENYVLENDYNVPDYAIVAKAITITADDKSSVYGESIVGLTAQITDGNGVYVLPDEDSEVFVLTKEQGVNAGEYVITVNVVGNSNYIVTPVNGKYTINKKAVTVAPDDKAITYGDNNVTLTYATTGLVGEETLTGVTLTREEGNNAGTYVITATHDDTLDGNYIVTITGTATYTIGQKAVTVTPDDKTVTYGDDEANLTYAVTGLVGEETLTGITLTREEGTNAGTYVITATHDDALDRNYAVTITSTSAYTIQKKANTINTDEIVKEYTYSGSNFTVDGATALGDGVISYENNVVKEAGSHTVIVKVAEGTNYLAAETTVVVAVKETAPVKNDESGTNTHGKIISVENAQEGTSMTEIFKNAQADESESKEIKAFIGSTIVVFDEAAIEEISAAEEEVELVLNVTYVEEEQAITPENFKDAEVIVRVSLSNGVTFASGKATITLDYDKEIPKGKIVKVYYVDQDGNRIDMNATFVDGKIVFETNHFSDYIVVIEDVNFNIGWISFIFGMIVLLYFTAFIVLTKVFGKNRKLLCYIGLAASAAVIVAAIVIVAVLPGIVSALSFGLCAIDALLFILYGPGKDVKKDKTTSKKKKRKK